MAAQEVIAEHGIENLSLREEDPREDLKSLGMQYMEYARQHPLEYRLMFSTTWPESADATGGAKHAFDATHAFDVLRGVLRRMHGDGPEMRDAVDLDALYIWSTVHGLAGVMNGPCIGSWRSRPK